MSFFYRAAFLSFLLITVQLEVFAQPGCPNIDAGPDLVVDCNVNCVDLTATVLETGETTSYAVSSIPYAPPSPFTGGTAQFINIDDIWGDVITLPFNFCFYGNVYSQLVIGANGLLTFDLTQATQYCEWSYNSPCPTPGPPPGALYNNSIMGAYHDIDPSVCDLFTGNCPSDINYILSGVAPCRIFTINFTTVPHFSCNSLETTQQIVLYETTNVIEVYIEDKPTCNGWNDGNATIGLQDATGANGITPPGRNTGPWSASLEAWRFTPDGVPNFVISWYDGGNLIGTGPTLNVCPSATTTYDAEAVYTNCDGTVVTVTDQVTVTQNSTVSVTVNPTIVNFCEGESVVLTANSPNAGITYSWSSAVGLSATTGAVVTASPTTSTLYTVTADDSNCTASANVSINVGSVQLQSSSTGVTCAGNDGTVTVTPSGGVGAYTYAWNTVPVQTTQTATGLADGNYDVTVTDAAGCTATAAVTVNPSSNSLSPPQMTSTDALCGASDGTATATLSDGTAPYTYSWDSNPIQTAQTATVLAPGNYTVIVNDAAGCVATASVVVGFQGNMSASIGTSSDVSCFGTCDGSATANVMNGTGVVQYLWDDPNNQTTQTAIGLCAGTYNVGATDATGCSATAQVIITEPMTIVVNAVMDAESNCNQPDGQVSATATGGTVVSGYQYSWDSAPVQNTAVATGLLPAIYSVTVTDDNGCIQTGTVTITTTPGFTASIQSSSDVPCFQSCDGTATVGLGSGAILPVVYAWNTVPVQTTQTAIGLCASDLSVEITDAVGCIATADITITEPPLLVVDAGSFDILCHGDNDGRAFASASGGAAPYQLAWSDPLSQTTDTILYLPPGSFMVTITDAQGCTADTAVTVVEPLPLVPEFSVGSDTCYYHNGSILTQMQGGTSPFQYVWTPAIEDSADYVADQINNWNQISGLTFGDYSVEITDAGGCEANGSATVPLIPPPVADFLSRSEPEEFVDPIVQFDNESSGAVTYEWHLGDGNVSYLENPEHAYDTSGVFLVMLIAYNDPVYGCADTAFGYIEVDPFFTFYVPSAFTPDGDGRNDGWGPVGQHFEYESYRVQIYDRWGGLLWETDNPQQEWDGTFLKSGKEVKQGLYIYVFNLKKFNTFEPTVIKGTVTLYRHN